MLASHVSDSKDLRERAAVSADATGGGDPVNELLEEVLGGRAVTGVQFNSAVKRALIEGLRMKIERQSLWLPSHPELIRQLKHFRSDQSAAGNQRLNAQSGYHDDLVIALALAASALPASYAAPILVGNDRKFECRRRLKFEDIVWNQTFPPIQE